MYRVAVIQNESEMLRSGFTNVIPKLRNIKRLSDYSFEPFNVVNIRKLFQEGDSYLPNFDSIFITTNATSDIAVLAQLREHKSLIDDFISSGRGLFVSSQKKLSTDRFDPKTDNGKTKFLPDNYEFFTVVRPKIEKDSGIGAISLFESNEHILLQYPNRVTVQETMEHCERNEFKQHYYRSHILPHSNGAFIPILVDTSYQDVSCRNLLMVNPVPQHGERVVVSTIALDWEFHESLLTNIIVYTTEGLPKVAFIDNAKVKHGDFDFLLTSAKLSKISHEIYSDATKIRSELFNVHNTYIFSPDWTEEYVIKFVKSTISSGGDKDKDTAERPKSYLRVYYFKQNDEVLTLTQYSNFSTIDLIIDSSVLWLTSMFPGGMWGRSFWVTYDIVTMMCDIGIDVETYISPLIKDIRKHYSDYSYDGVMGATCGLLELLIQLRRRYENELVKEHISSRDLKGILGWINEKYDSQSEFDKETAILTLSKYHSELLEPAQDSVEKEKYSKMLEGICAVDASDQRNESSSEIDLCRNIAVALLCPNRETEVAGLLASLKAGQTPTGKWTNTGRTAHVLVFLLKELSRLKTIINTDVNIDDLIYNGILHLRAEYNWKSANWDNDIQATAKALHAIGLYNKHYKYSTQDFFKTLEIESDKLYSATVIHNVSENMRQLRKRSNEMLVKIDTLSETNISNEGEMRDYELYESENTKEVRTARTVATICGTLLIGLIFYLVAKHPSGFLKEVRQIDALTIFLSFAIGLALTGIAQKTVLKSDLINRKKRKGKQLK